LARDGERFADRHRSAPQAIGQRRAVDKLEDEAAPGPDILNAIDGADVRMIERREDLGFAIEAGAPLGIACEYLGQHFDRDLASELGLPGAIDLSPMPPNPINPAASYAPNRAPLASDAY
jgi:hypothetical protein